MKKIILNSKLRFIFILVAFYAVIVAVALILFPENLAFKGPNPNPYFIMALFFAAFYGIAEAATAGLVANILFFFLIHLQTDYEAVETIFDLETVLTASLFSVLAIFIGELRTMGKGKLAATREIVAQKEKVLQLLTSEFENNIKNSEELKAKLLSKTDTFAILYQDSKKLNAFERETIFEGLESILIKHLSATRYGIYFSQDGNTEKFQLVHGKGERLSPEIDLSQSRDEQLAKILTAKKCLMPEEVWSKTDFNSHQGKILMGAPLTIRGLVKGLVLIYELPFLKYVPYNFKLFEIYASWASESLEKAQHFQNVEQFNIVNRDYDIYKWEYICGRLEEEFHRSKIFDLPLTIAKIDASGMPPDTQEIVLQGLIAVIKNLMRKMDCVAQGPSLGNLVILMPVADQHAAYRKIEEIQGHFPEDVWSKIKVDVASFTSEMENSGELLKGFTDPGVSP